MVQQTTGYKIQMLVFFQSTHSLMVGKYTAIAIYRLVLNAIFKTPLQCKHRDNGRCQRLMGCITVLIKMISLALCKMTIDLALRTPQSTSLYF